MGNSNTDCRIQDDPTGLVPKSLASQHRPVAPHQLEKADFGFKKV
jgi:hypothetical protein